MKSLARRADRSVRTFLRFVAVVAAFVAVVVYWNFGTFSPCAVLREAIRQRGDLVAIFPDGVIDFAFEAQFGEMSAKRCFAVLLEAVTSPVPTTGQASQLSMQPFAPRQGKQRSSPSVPRARTHRSSLIVAQSMSVMLPIATKFCNTAKCREGTQGDIGLAYSITSSAVARSEGEIVTLLEGVIQCPRRRAVGIRRLGCA